jgi:Tol biopolymer transport system component
VAATTATLVPGTANAEDGEMVVLSPDASDRYRPALIDDSGERILANINSITSPALSPDKTRVAFAGALGNESLGLYALFVVNIDGTNLRQLTSGSYGEFDPAWSPDGRRIVISQNQSGRITATNCCRIAVVDATSGAVTGLNPAVGAARPTYTPNGASIIFDNPSGVWRMPASGGAATAVAKPGYDPTVSPDGARVAYLVSTTTQTQLRTVPIGGGASRIIYSTSGELESPEWVGSRIYFVEYTGLGYDGRKNVRIRSVNPDGSSPRTERSLPSHHVGLSITPGNDEIFFYRSTGSYRYYDIRPDAGLGTPIQGGENYSTGWSSIPSIDLDGDGSDEMLFYKKNGVFKYYDLRPDATLRSLIRSGTGYSKNWSTISSVDLDGDRRDEIFFYRTSGSFRFYDITPTAALGSRLQGGEGFSKGWTTITAIDLNGDGTDEMLFYRATDGAYKYYSMRPDGRLRSLINSGTDYANGWTSIVALDLDGDGQDEILFYRSSGSYRYYQIRPNGTLESLIDSGSDYSTGWTWLTGVDVDG